MQSCTHIYTPDTPRKGFIYHIAVIFRGSKFSRIAVLEEFVEKISRMGVAQFATPII